MFRLRGFLTSDCLAAAVLATPLLLACGGRTHLDDEAHAAASGPENDANPVSLPAGPSAPSEASPSASVEDEGSGEEPTEPSDCERACETMGDRCSSQSDCIDTLCQNEDLWQEANLELAERCLEEPNLCPQDLSSCVLDFSRPASEDRTWRVTFEGFPEGGTDGWLYLQPVSETGNRLKWSSISGGHIGFGWGRADEYFPWGGVWVFLDIDGDGWCNPEVDLTTWFSMKLIEHADYLEYTGHISLLPADQIPGGCAAFPERAPQYPGATSPPDP